VSVKPVYSNAILQQSLGFTIVETLIVLSISSIIGVSALIMLTDRIKTNNFTTNSNNFVQNLQKIIFDTASGYYYNNAAFSCDGTVSPIQTSPGSTDQGENYGCVSLGSVVQFSTLYQPNRLVIIPLAGNQYQNLLDTNVSQTITQANPVPLYPHFGSGSSLDLSQAENLEGGLKVFYLKADGIPTGAIGFLPGDASGNLAAYDVSGNLNSGSQSLSLYNVHNTNLNESTTSVANKINATNLTNAHEIQICVTDDSGQSDLVSISGTNVSEISSQIKTGNTC
jgi:type II secretory pathway pseudopilin PulG